MSTTNGLDNFLFKSEMTTITPLILMCDKLHLSTDVGIIVEIVITLIG